MRRAIALTGMLLAAIVATVRVLEKPLYVGPDSYAYLLSLSLDAVQAFIYHAVLLAALLGIAAAVVSRYDLPDESLLVLTASPAIITALVLPGPGIILGILGSLVIALWDTPAAVPLGMIAMAFHPAGAVILLFTIIRSALGRRIVLTTLGSAAFVSLVLSRGLPMPQLRTFAELGSLGGISIFIALLAIAGTFLWWNAKTYPRLIAAASATLVSAAFPVLSVLTAVLLAGVAGYALQVLSTRQWRLESIRTASILLVICGLLFTAASTGAQAARAEPSADLLGATAFLQGVGASDILVPPELGPILRWYGIPTAEPVVWRSVLSTRNVDQAAAILPRYVLLHSSTDATNLSFMIENTDDFTLVRAGEYAVWEVVR